MLNLSKYRLPFFFSIVLFLILATTLAVIYNRGYKIDFSKRALKPTGILAISSSPVGAKVYIDGELKTATNNTLTLVPGEYQIELKKPNFISWQKKITIEKELVTQLDAFLFPEVPDLKPLTFEGAENPQVSPDNSKIVYTVPLSVGKTAPQDKAGLWVVDLNDSLLGFSREPRQIARSQKTLDFSQASFFWSPDSRQILVEFKSPSKFLLADSNQFNQPASLVDISSTLPLIISEWQKENGLRQEARIKKLPLKLQEILFQSIGQFDFSADGTKMLYTATASAEIPKILIPPVLAASTQKESRKIEPNKVYVYDLKEDRNFLMPFELPKPTPTPKPSKTKTATPAQNLHQLLTFNFELLTISWFPTSRHLFWVEKDKVVACEYDGTNTATVYSGPFVFPSVFAPPGANKFMVLAKTNLDKDYQNNLYSVSLR